MPSIDVSDIAWIPRQYDNSLLAIYLSQRQGRACVVGLRDREEMNAVCSDRTLPEIAIALWGGYTVLRSPAPPRFPCRVEFELTFFRPARVEVGARIGPGPVVKTRVVAVVRNGKQALGSTSGSDLLDGRASHHRSVRPGYFLPVKTCVGTRESDIRYVEVVVDAFVPLATAVFRSISDNHFVIVFGDLIDPHAVSPDVSTRVTEDLVGLAVDRHA